MVLAHPADILASLALSDAITARARLRSAGSLDGHDKDTLMSELRRLLHVGRSFICSKIARPNRLYGSPSRSITSKWL
jgi:hypothetical protein